MTTTNDLLARARSAIGRVTPSELPLAMRQGALVVDIRPEAQRASEGSLDGAIVVERNVLEWRFDLDGEHCLPEARDPERRIVIVCSEGYASSLAAAVLVELGYPRATDLAGGYRALIGA
jgi:rhodanese-related sulfurtransferase